MVERKKELRRRRKRAEKMTQLKSKLQSAKTPHDREVILKKIHGHSPWWKEPAAAK